MTEPQTSTAAPDAPSRRFDPAFAVYLAVTGLSSACGLVVEIVAGRMIAPYLGMSLYTWTAVIAVVLAGFSAGHWVGGRIAEKPASAARRSVAASLFFAGLTAVLSLILIRILSGPILALGWGQVPTILLLTFALFFPPSFFVGIPSPALTKLAIDDNRERMGHVIGLFYAVGALGSIAGTLAAGYIFISYFGSIRTILTVAALYVAMAVALFAVDRLRAKEPLVTNATIVPVVLAAFAFAAVLVWGRGVKAFVENCTKESAYYCIRVIDITRDVGIPARTMVLDHLGHGTNLRDRPDLFLTPYVEAQDTLHRLHLGSRTDPKSFFIGGGAYTMPRGWLARWPQAEATVAEIDPEVTAFAKAGFWVPEDPRLKVRHEDARRALLAEPAGRFDVIVGDAFHDIAVPQHLVTEEFFGLVASRLKPDGIYLMNVIDSAAKPRLTLSILETLRRHFAVTELWKAEGQGGRQTYVVLAGMKPTPKEALYSRVDPSSAWHRMDAEQLSQLAAKTLPFVLTDDFAPVDRIIGVE